MQHNIRQRVINEYGLPVTKTETVHGELGSKVFDKNGKEIFENDLVQVKSDKRKAPVIFKDGMFFIKYSDVQRFALIQLRENEIEVVGHAENVD